MVEPLHTCDSGALFTSSHAFDGWRDRASLRGYTPGQFKERLQQFGRRDEAEQQAAAAMAAGEFRIAVSGALQH